MSNNSKKINLLPRDALCYSDIKIPWEDDLFNRKEVAERLINTLLRLDGPISICVNAPFGMGKTYFAKNLCSEIRQSGGHAIYFNAFYQDHQERSFFPLVNSIIDYFRERENVDVSDIMKSAKKILFSFSVGLVKGIIKKYVNENVLQEALQETLAGIDMEGMFKSERTGREEFINSLNDLVNNLKKSDANSTHQGKYKNISEKVFVIIDEIDRCRPEYAISLLEDIKILFRVEGFCFIVMSNNYQINSIAEAMYGKSFGGEGYINKFFDLKMSLPDININDFLKGIKKGHVMYSNRQIIDYIFKYEKLSVRQLVDLYNNLEIIKDKNAAPILLLLAIFATINYDKFCNKDFEYFIKKVKLKEKAEEIGGHLSNISALFLYLFCENFANIEGRVKESAIKMWNISESRYNFFFASKEDFANYIYNVVLWSF